MSETQAPDIEHAPVFDLDVEFIGQIIRLIPAVATRVGHKTLKGHLWYGADASPEHEFVRDVLTLPMTEVVEKWYGGAGNAGRFAAVVREALMADFRKPPA